MLSDATPASEYSECMAAPPPLRLKCKQRFPEEFIGYESHGAVVTRQTLRLHCMCACVHVWLYVCVCVDA